MDRFLLTAGTALALASFAAPPANAADLPVRRAPPPAVAAVPVFTWTGFYAGVNAGATRNASELRMTAEPSTFNRSPLFPPGLLTANDFAFLADQAHDHDTGFTGGAQIGYNYQIGTFVLGAEADINLADLRNRHDRADPIPASFAGGAGAGLTYNTHLRSDVDWFGTVRARAGVALDRALIYATGGLAYGEIKSNVAAFPTPADAFAAFGLIDVNRGSHSDTRTGWTVGGGVEYALTDNLTLKGEYLYVDLGKARFLAPAVQPAVFPDSIMSVVEETKFHVIRAGVNYKFGTW